METKQCSHLKEGIGINRDFLKARKSDKASKFQCLGKKKKFIKNHVRMKNNFKKFQYFR